MEFKKNKYKFIKKLLILFVRFLLNILLISILTILKYFLPCELLDDTKNVEKFKKEAYKF